MGECRHAHIPCLRLPDAVVEEKRLPATQLPHPPGFGPLVKFPLSFGFDRDASHFDAGLDWTGGDGKRDVGDGFREQCILPLISGAEISVH